MILPKIFRRRKRSYPWFYEANLIHGVGHKCEACKRQAVMAVRYELAEHEELSQIFLCLSHYRLAFTGQWRPVFKDMNAKIKRGETNE